MAAHDYIDFYSAERTVIEIVAHKGLCHKFSGRTESGRVIVFAQVVIDRLTDMEAVQVVVGLLRFFADDVRGFRGVVAADVEEKADVIFFQGLENLCAVFGCGFAPNGAECGRGCVRYLFERFYTLLFQVDKILVQNALDAVKRSVDPLDLSVLFPFKNRAN